MASFVVNGSNSNVLYPSGTSITVQLTNVAAGELIVVYTRHDGAPTTMSVSDGTSSFEAGTLTDHANGDFSAQFHYLLTSVATGTVTYTCTVGAARASRMILVARVSYTGTASLDVQNTGQGTSTAPASGTVTTTGTDEIVWGCYADYSGQLTTAEKINAVDADAVIDDSANHNDAMWYRVLSATFANGTASGTIAVSNPWICHVIAFKAAAGGAASVVTPRLLALLGVGA